MTLRKVSTRIRRLTCVLFLFLVSPYFLEAQTESNGLSDQDRAFLSQIQRDSFIYFEKLTHPQTGLVRDSSAPASPASIAATGFGLAAYSIAQANGWVSYRDAYEVVEKTFKTLETDAGGENGFFYHFLDPASGKRAWSSELSSIDTALLMAGVLLAGEYFKGTDLEEKSNRLYEQVDWPWMMNGTFLICHGWKPGRGFLPYYWDMYSEHLILLALAMGSPTFPVSKQAWNEWVRFEDEYNGRKIVYSHTGSLFTYQYSQAFIDFRDLNDLGINYFENSKQATLANKEFCLANKDLFPSYSEQVWGLSASLGPHGYKAYGAKPGLAIHDGTVAPYTIAASTVFAPAESLESLRFIYDNYGAKIYGPYGFHSAFNVAEDWWASESLGIDEGIVVVMLENVLRDGEVWKRFMELPAMKRWIKRAELRAEKPLPND